MRESISWSDFLMRDARLSISLRNLQKVFRVDQDVILQTEDFKNIFEGEISKIDDLFLLSSTVLEVYEFDARIVIVLGYFTDKI